MAKPDELVGLCAFRPLLPEELNLVLDSWTEASKRSVYAGTVPNHLYSGVVKELIAGLLARGAKITVAAEPETNRVMGWVCHETKGNDGVVHFVYVKSTWRNLGLGTELFRQAAGAQTYITARTKPGDKLMRKFDARFVPEIARRKDL